MTKPALPKHRLAMPTGSRVICNPPPTDTDEDWVVLVLDLEAFRVMAEADGWELTTDLDYQGDQPGHFNTYRKGHYNLVVTESAEEYRRWRLATAVAQRLNLMAKEDRIMLFQAILYGAMPQTDYPDQLPID